MNHMKSTKSQSNFEQKEMTDPEKNNPLFGNLDGFTFGVAQDTGKDKYLSQSDRIFALNKVINEFMNIDWLKEQKIVIE